MNGLTAGGQGWTGHLAYRASSRWAVDPMWAGLHREKKPKSLEVEAAKCAKLTDLFGAGFTSPAAAGAPGDERGGLDNDERVEADMVRNAGLGLAGLHFCSMSKTK
ncbi:unnamed protein product [Pleuronectes platessa]|uniref:Uncharacterized protein n=1 Tax=Pleuronectes platessa TaxID=8262 RepID=A0A9N7YPZ3_PLEPL|nr:unnamed protein product [Pleuronectes platessa]